MIKGDLCKVEEAKMIAEALMLKESKPLRELSFHCDPRCFHRMPSVVSSM